MQVLILGGSGLIGKFILNNNKKRFQMFTTYNKEKISSMNSIYFNYPDNFSSLEKYIDKIRPDVILNTIALSNPEYCENNKQLAYDINVNFPKMLTALTSKKNIRLIHLSTNYVFDGKQKSYTENDKPNPKNYYGETKLLSENHVLSNPNNLVIRTSALYGISPKIRFFNYVIESLIKSKPISVFGDYSFNPTLIDELVEVIFRLFDLETSGIIHVCGSSCTSKFNFVKSICQIFNFDQNLINFNLTKDVKVPQTVCMDNTYATNLLNYRFSLLDEGLGSIHDSILQQYHDDK
tara:strand:+ start:2659 stop:3537 length:879 start_codon:yes stop_codon:yes gene_type:complete